MWAKYDHSPLHCNVSPLKRVRLQILEKERREKSALIQELGQKEQRIYEMEKIVMELNRVCKDHQAISQAYL